MKRTLQLSLLFGATMLGAALAGCNTIEGFGKDLTAAGTAISGAVSKDEKKAPQAPLPPAPVQAQAPAPAPAPVAPGPAPAPQRR